MPHIEFDLSTKLSPKQVRSMLTDFSPHRPEIWPQLSPEEYEVYNVDATSAYVKEGVVNLS